MAKLTDLEMPNDGEETLSKQLDNMVSWDEFNRLLQQTGDIRMPSDVDRFAWIYDRDENGDVYCYTRDDNGVYWFYKDGRLFTPEGDNEFIELGEDPEQNGYMCDSLDECNYILLDSGYTEYARYTNGEQAERNNIWSMLDISNPFAYGVIGDTTT